MGTIFNAWRLAFRICQRKVHHAPLLETTSAFSTSMNLRLPPDSSSAVTSPDDLIDKFILPEVQDILKSFIQVDYKVIFRRKSLRQPLEKPEYTFMSVEQLDKSLKDAEVKAESMLQVPPVLRERKEIDKVIGYDPVLQGLDPHNADILCTDISLNVSNLDRIIVVRQPDGTLRHATWTEREKANKAYFPIPNQDFRNPKMLADKEILMQVLSRASPSDNTYVFALDRACLQLEPDDPSFISVVETIYNFIDEREHYDYLQSTRHMGSLVFYLARHRQTDKFLGFLISSERISEAGALVSLFHVLFPESKSANLEAPDDVTRVSNYIEKDAVQSSDLRLRLNAYVENQRAREERHKGLQSAHGF